MVSDRSYHLLARIYHSRSCGQAVLVSAISDFVLQIPCKFQDMTCSNLLQACSIFANLFSWGQASCLHPLAWSSLTSPTDLQQFPRCQLLDGLRLLPTLALLSLAVASMTTRLAPRVTMASRSWLPPTLRRRPRSCQQSLPTADWPWWPSSECSFRTWKIKDQQDVLSANWTRCSFDKLPKIHFFRWKSLKCKG